MGDRGYATFGHRFGALIERYRKFHGYSIREALTRIYDPDGDNLSFDPNNHTKNWNEYRKGRRNVGHRVVEMYRIGLGIPQTEIDAIRSPEEQNIASMLQRMVSEVYSTKEIDISEEQVYTLAEKIAGKSPDLISAIVELSRNIDLSEKIIGQSLQISNSDSDSKRVLVHLSELNKADLFDEGADFLEDQVAILASQQSQLLQTLVDQHTIRRDSRAVAQAIYTRDRHEYGVGPSLGKAIFEECQNRIADAKASGSLFECEVVFSLVDISIDR